tara:strand:- start:33822 stop:35645 length:1824 start_codon:yes stop_codon:yes gene_type:complete
MLTFKQPPLNNNNDWPIIHACNLDDIETLISYHDMGKDFDSIHDFYGDGLLHVSIFSDAIHSFHALLDWGMDIEKVSYSDSATPLNVAAMVGDLHYITPLVEMGADVNTMDYYGFTPLHNSIYFEEYDAANYFLSLPEVDVNIASYDEFTPLLESYFYGNEQTTSAIIQHPTFDSTYNILMISEYYDDEFLQDMKNLGVYADEDIIEAFHLAKLLGHRYDLGGTFSFANLDYSANYFSYEGYSNNLSVAEFTRSYEYFLSHVVLTSTVPSWANEALISALDALQFQDSNTDAALFHERFVSGQSVILASGWNGHAVEIVLHQDRLYRCNRGDQSDGVHGIEEFMITKPNNLTLEILDIILEASGPPTFLQHDLVEILGLEKIGEIENPEQIAGNCTWTSLEAGLEALILTNLLENSIDADTAHSFAKQAFELWEEFDMTHGLEEFISHSDILIGNSFYDELLADIFNTLDTTQSEFDFSRQAIIYDELLKPEFSDLYDELVGQYVEQYVPLYDSIYDNYMENTSIEHADYIAGKHYYEFINAYNESELNNDHFILSLEDIFSSGHSALSFDMSSASTITSEAVNISPMPVLQTHILPEPDAVDYIIV